MARQISLQVQRVLKAHNISLDELEEMISRSAIITNRGYNRRFHQWGFALRKDGSIFSMGLEEPVEVGIGPDKMEEICQSCNGHTCEKCGWSGSIIRRIQKQ